MSATMTMPVYRFKRYRFGHRLAEGVRINTAISLTEARQKAASLYAGCPGCEHDEYVLDDDDIDSHGQATPTEQAEG